MLNVEPKSCIEVQPWCCDPAAEQPRVYSKKQEAGQTPSGVACEDLSLAYSQR